MIKIRKAVPSAPEIRHLIDTHIAYGNAHYPVDSNHHLTESEHLQNEVELFAAWRAEECLGMAGLKRLPDGSGELKSMHVLHHGRGLGVGQRLLAHVLEVAKQQGLHTLRLETGSREASKTARVLYEKLGFTYCPPFADYTEDPESVFMQLSL